MLDHILRQAYDFERRHGVAPDVIYLNEDHYNALQEDAPGLFSDPPAIPLGFSIMILPRETLLYPRAAVITNRACVRLSDNQHAIETD